MSYNITQAHEVAIKSLKNEPIATAVVIEFVSISGLTKYLKVTRDDQVEVLNSVEELEAA